MPAIVIEETTSNYTISSSSSSTSSLLGSSRPSGGGPGTFISFPFSTEFSINPPSVRDLLSNQQQNFYQQQQQQQHQQQHQQQQNKQYDIFDDDDLFDSPLPFDASEYGLWNGRFVPPPPRPPFLDDAIIPDGVTTCDLCSWAMPTKSTFIFEGTIEKATELGWPLTLIIVSIISAVIGAIIMVTVVRYKRKKSTNNNRNETHVQWWSRNKRANNHIRRSNIYTAHPADSIRGLHHNNTDTCNWSNVTTIVVTS